MPYEMKAKQKLLPELLFDLITSSSYFWGTTAMVNFRKGSHQTVLHIVTKIYKPKTHALYSTLGAGLRSRRVRLKLKTNKLLNVYIFK